MESNAVFNVAATEFFRHAATNPRYTGFVVQESWLSPDIRKGDFVVVDTGLPLEVTGIFAFDSPFGKTIARLQRKVLGGVKAIWDWPERDVVDLDGEPDVIGKVVMVFREVQ